MSNDRIPFNRPFLTGNEISYAAEAFQSSHLSGDGKFTKQCHHWIEMQSGCDKALLTQSCTAALDMAALLFRIEPGDEVILPSFTFVSTANAFVLRGAKPVFVDIREDTLNIDETLLEAAITPCTKAIVPVHYAGVSCEMDAIIDVAKRYDLRVIEDAAQGLLSSYKGRALGSIGDVGCFSFHETKNIIAGEGGCLLVNDGKLSSSAEIMREKGTDRGRFFRGEVDKYTWQDVGSSFLPSELTASFLWAQLERADHITRMRLDVWQRYHEMLEQYEQKGLLRRPVVPADCEHNGHLYYIILAPDLDRQKVLDVFRAAEIGAVFHYVPLHSSPAGQRFGRSQGDLSNTDSLSQRLIRLPLWPDLRAEQQERVVDVLDSALRNR